ncbi:MAG: hypothetical protein HRU34_02910 [Richelia sp.]|nr:hypothetical protein [Richelia sp.]CDN15684.1 hypothetical protein RintRC_2504 [Richelia intracellularis]
MQRQKILDRSSETPILPAIQLHWQKAITSLIHTSSKTVFSLGKICLRTLQACFYTMWAIILTTLSTGTSIFTGFLV